MFKHSLTNKKYYSIREKINYYERVISAKEKDVSAKTKRKAPLRLKTLHKLNNRNFDEPTLVVVNDKQLGNPIAKPRLAVAYKMDEKEESL